MHFAFFWKVSTCFLLVAASKAPRRRKTKTNMIYTIAIACFLVMVACAALPFIGRDGCDDDES